MIIRTFDDPVLRRAAAPVRRVNASVRRLAAEMAETMREHRGVGLAAPQVGVLSRLIVVDVGEGLHTLVNPKVVSSEGATVDWEGCLSFPGLLAEVERAAKVTVEATDLRGKTMWVEGEGFLARALQHEIDHLDGIVILDRAEAVEKVPASDPPAEDAPGAPEREETGPSPPDPLRVAFLGTPAFALPTLRAIVEAGHHVVVVVTQPDRSAGRGGRTARSPEVKQLALGLGLPVFQGTAEETRSNLARLLRLWQVDVAVVVAYGVILPRDALDAPRLGCVNLHASLLPDYRGAAPIQRALMDGKRVTGVTVIRMDEGLDTGDILGQREVEVAPEETGGSLHDKLSTVGARLVVCVLEELTSGRSTPRPQPAGQWVAAPRLTPEDEVISWERPAREIGLRVRALTPAPGAHTLFRGERVKLWRIDELDSGGEAGGPGRVVSFDGGDPVLATGLGLVSLRVVQPAGRGKMAGSAFANGYRVKLGDAFGV